MTDIEIARNAKLKKIDELAKEIGIEDEDIELYGKYKAKIPTRVLEKLNSKKNGKLILVTAISPTPLGEGKTTLSISLADGLAKIGKKSILALREPSLGPVFGIKGGATGGGMSQVVPMEDINLHFTGDIHAITSANNLLSALIDNHIFHGNSLNFKRVTWNRVLDLNDRQLRKVNTGLSDEKNMTPREDKFNITVASEIMAILCLSENMQELKERLGNIIVGYNNLEEPIYAKDLKAEGSMAVLLKDAINPNLVQTLEHTPAIIHGGPFANIAHGCNSILATKIALKLGDYAVTEAGFGADLGAEKFIDIKCRKMEIKPDVAILVVTIKSLKYHGGAQEKEILAPNITALEKGMANLYKHINNLKNEFGLNVIVALNKYNSDTLEEIEFLKTKLEKMNVDFCVSEGWEKGGNGSIELAKKVVELSEKETNLKYAYQLEDSIREKIFKISTKIYGAENVQYSDEALKEIKIIEKMGYGNLPICIAKTQFSFSDDSNKLECNENFTIHISSVELKAGSGFIVAYAGKIMTMPGLPKKPSAEKIDIDENGVITGIF
jgi:formate--tetrahydrofolate ligase